MAITALNTSTLSEALTASTADFTVGSTTNITVGDLLVIRQELVKVQAIPVSGRVQVMRGYEGTEARAHATSQRFFILANPHDAKINTKRQLALVGASGVYPDYLFPGQEADDGVGNRYILVDNTATIYSGATVAISLDGLYTAAVLVGGAQGRVGVTVEAGTSDQYVWAQVRGNNSFVQDQDATTDATSAYIATAATSLSTPPAGMLAVAQTTIDAYVIHGMWITGIATSTTTSATSSTGAAVPVFLHDPYVRSIHEPTADPTS
jgi:hypothetical protein